MAETVRKRVLVVDDDPESFPLCTTFLGEEGCRVFHVCRGEECAAAIERERPEVIFVALALPGIGGPETVRIARRTDKDIQCIAITDRADGQSVAGMMEAGVTDCLHKPLEQGEVVAAVRRAIDVRRVKSSHHYLDLEGANRSLEESLGELRRKVTEASMLNEVSKILTSKLDLADVLNTVMKMAGEMFQAQAYSIRLLNEEEKLLHLVAHYGLSEEYLQRGPIPVGESVAGAVVLQRKPIHVADALRYQPLFKVDVARREGLKSIFCFPLINRERCIGVMTFYHKKKHYYRDDEMQFLSTFACSVSIAVDNARLYEKQTRLAISDGLTGLHNHKYFQEVLETEISRAQRYGCSMSIIMLDIDHFKKYNDAHGHQAGDALLKKISSLLRKVARDNDLVARYGGEEFVYILHQATKSEAMLFARRLHRRVFEYSFEGESVLPDGKLTVSLGVASFPDDAGTAQTLVNMADQALYVAKNKGRNQVQAFQGVT